MIIAARRTYDGGHRSLGPVDSIRSQLEANASSVRGALEKRGATVLLEVADSLLITTDTEFRRVTVPFGDTASFVFVSPRRPPRVVFGLQAWPDARVVAEADWYLFSNEDPQDHGARSIKRVSPTAFPGLPAEIATKFDSAGCTIPQSDFAQAPNNVIKGSFARRGQTDWAVLCSRRGVTAILVFWGGPSDCPREFETGQEKGEFEENGRGGVLYERVIVSADSTEIANIPVFGLEEDLLAARREALSPIGHDGIEEGWEEKGSSVWYCTGGHWISLGGGD